MTQNAADLNLRLQQDPPATFFYVDSADLVLEFGVMNSPTTLAVEDRDGVRIVALDRPDALNAFSATLMDELADVFLSATTSDDVRVLVLTGKGRAFTAGADLKEMGQQGARPRHGWPGLLDAIIDFPKPFILAINGIGAGVGATICGLADMAFMCENARLRCPFSALGLTAEAGSTLLFPQLMGRQWASWFLLSSQWLSAEQCVAAGLAMAICKPEELMTTTLQHADTLAQLPLASLVTTKTLMMDPIREQLRAHCQQENAALAGLVGGPANREALAAFREKRQPDFTQL